MFRCVICSLCLCVLPCGLPAQNKQGEWWKSAVIYQVYPRSFGDTNGDGTGDLNGITEHLDYLQSLGVDGIWITPYFPSPQVDFGYDVSDFRGIDPQYGTMADFDRLVAEAKKHNIYVLADIVLNHTSDKHAWFQESKSSRTNSKADWFVWRDGKNGGPPNNWLSLFGGSAWTYVPARKQYYYHRFYKEQPDLDWNNREVREAMYDVVRFWMNKGVAGFRLDAVTSMFEDPQFRDEPYTGKTTAFGDRAVTMEYTQNLPKMHEVFKELRKVADEKPGTVLIGETYVDTIGDLLALYGNNDELHLPMDLQLGWINKLSAARFRKLLTEAETELKENVPLFALENHDNSRSVNRYGSSQPDAALAKLLATVLLTPRDSALIYYGEEIGMVDHPPKSRNEVQDPQGRRGWPKEKGRDAERTPMQWNNDSQAGFSSAKKTWLPVGSDYKTINVKAESPDPHSVLSYYKKLIELKKSNPQLRDGDFEALDKNNESVLSFRRKTKDGESVVVTMNMTRTPQTVNLGSGKGQALISSFEVQDTRVDLSNIKLPALGAVVTQVGR